MQLILLAVFGALGTLTRYALAGAVQARTGPGFPAGTLVVNLIGSFLLGGLTQYALHRLSIPPEWRVAITMGFLGAFTTFSTFSWETAKLLEDGEWLNATLYVGLTGIGGLVAVIGGMRLADRF